jgi:two-component system NtrC family sensor kinase
MQHLFEPFAQQREARKGLGLWVTYQIVRQLGGEIEVRSQPGQTVFAARLPIQEESA